MNKNSRSTQSIILIFVLPITILICVFILLYIPIDLVRYWFSYRRREMKRLYGKDAKYVFLITLTDHYKVFELFYKNKFPILFVRKKTNPCDCGYFYYNHILFLVDVVPHFNVESGSWYIGYEQDETDLTGYVDANKESFYELTGHNDNVKCERVVFLSRENYFYDEEKSFVEKADFILTYNKKNFAEKLNKFISM